MQTRVNFNTKLEARWGKFFDALGITFEYKPIEFLVETQFGKEKFRPNFYLPELKTWVIVAAIPPMNYETQLAISVAKELKGIEKVVIFWSGFTHETSDRSVAFWYIDQMDRVVATTNHVFMVCPGCGRVGILPRFVHAISPAGPLTTTADWSCPCQKELPVEQRQRMVDGHPRLLEAYQRAQSVA